MDDGAKGPEQRVGEYVLRRGGLQDRDAILASFNHVFSQAQDGFRPRSRAEWDWAYARNPAGHQIWLAVHDSGTVAAHFAGLPLRVRGPEGALTFSHIVDSFTHPDHRRGLKRPGLFVRTANAFIDALVWPERNAILYGFPIPQPMRLGRRMIGYEVVRTQSSLWLRGDLQLPGEAQAPAVTTDQGFAAVTEALGERVRGPDGLMGVRDRAFLEWRFEQRPGSDYRVASVEGAEGLRGLAVLAFGAFGGLPQGLIVDWLVPHEDQEAAVALLAWAREESRAAGFDGVGILLPDEDPHWQGLQALGMRVRPSPYRLVYGDLERDPRFDEGRLRTHWRYTLAETDLA